MLAEIHRKISSNGSNLSDRLEDKLTGDFFGALRYLPFHQGFKSILSAAEFTDPATQNSWLSLIGQLKDYEVDIDFWSRHEEGEIDLILQCLNALIGVEVKYLSGLSSDDEEDEQAIDYTESRNQLARYSRMLERLSNKQPAYLLFLAPFHIMNAVKKSVLDRPIISPAVSLGFLCWEDLFSALSQIDTTKLDKGQALIIDDLKALLTKKNLIRFKGFNLPAGKKPLNDVAYTFQSAPVIQQTNWAWPAKEIKEEHYYDFND
ncbi:hypothetical protein [Pseudobacillus badius]|uniref:hypothetical protein n=1 Tax=Bacillus badius TaxID=1455 RepID=UPI0024A3B7D8|nr:hypothetical protein [Bacillus badius]GLY09070.1 hypothetical protein Bbad01_02860 [Bacillus badius]